MLIKLSNSCQRDGSRPLMFRVAMSREAAAANGLNEFRYFSYTRLHVNSNSDSRGYPVWRCGDINWYDQEEVPVSMLLRRL